MNSYFDNSELEWRLIYAVIVAGKSARFAEGAMQRLGLRVSRNPFNVLRAWINQGSLGENLRNARTGNYRKLAKCITELVQVVRDLSTCSAEELEQVHGIGPKTARFFIIWTRPEARHAALDVHVLRWMRANGYENAPKATPTGQLYAELEKAFIAEADKRNLTPAELDAQIWKAGSKYE